MHGHITTYFGLYTTREERLHAKSLPVRQVLKREPTHQEANRRSKYVTQVHQVLILHERSGPRVSDF